jgi:hypothetical protein
MVKNRRVFIRKVLLYWSWGRSRPRQGRKGVGIEGRRKYKRKGQEEQTVPPKIINLRLASI